MTSIKWIRKPSNLARIVCLISSFIFLAVLFNNCAKGFEVQSAASSDLGSSGGSGPDWLSQRDFSLSESAMPSSKNIAGSASLRTSSCLSDTSVDACIFWKNPVAQKGSTYPITANSDLLRFQTDLNDDQRFGVQFSNQIDPRYLESSSLYIFSSKTQFEYFDLNQPQNGYNSNVTVQNIRSLSRSQTSGGRLNVAYKDDGTASAGNKDIAQAMAYFWLNHLESELVRRTGKHFSAGKKTYVDAYGIGRPDRDDEDGDGNTTETTIPSELQSNAFFTFDSTTLADGSEVVNNGYIVMGGAIGVNNQNQGVVSHEMALSSEVYLHEMGHSNFLYAAGLKALEDTQNLSTNYRVTKCDGSPNQVFTQYRIASYDAIGTIQTNLNSLCNDGLSGTSDTNGQDFVIEGGDASFCSTANGCVDAINEGQADFHYLMIFGFDQVSGGRGTALAETITNNMAGGLGNPPLRQPGCQTLVPNSPGLSRDVGVLELTRFTDFYNRSAVQFNNCSVNGLGEIHGMGTAYASFLWEAYRNTDKKRSFEQAFQLHLTMMQSSTRFVEAREALLAADSLVCGGCNADTINRAYNLKMTGVRQ